MAKTFSAFMRENADLETLKSALKDSYRDYKMKDVSAKRFIIYVSAKDRMSTAEKISKDFNGELAKDGNVAGKPVVDLPFGLRVFVKPIPGTGVGGTAKEDAQLRSLQQQIEDALTEDDVIEIQIKIGGRLYNVAGAATTPGTPKSDFHLLDAKGNQVVWISHKDGSKPSDFQQWSGMSQRSEPEIYNHPESRKFIDDVKKITGSVMPRETTLSRVIKNSKLVNMAVYGNKFGSAFGIQNVTILLQGPVKLVKRKDFYELQSNHTSTNGESMTNGYEPSFMAIYKGDRSNFDVKGARFAIQPKASRKSKEI